MIFYFINIILIIAAFKVFGLILVLILSVGIYFLLQAKLDVKKKIPEQAMFAVAYIMGIFAVHSIFGKAEITLMAIIFEFAIFFIFSGFSEH